jgi:hypothetical protein
LSVAAKQSRSFTLWTNGGNGSRMKPGRHVHDIGTNGFFLLLGISE